MNRRLWYWVHRQLNKAVLYVGHWPLIGDGLWWVYGLWQTVIPDEPAAGTPGRLPSGPKVHG